MNLGGLVGGSAAVVGQEATLEDAAAAMIDAGTGSLAVIDGRQLVGIITERDVVRAIGEGADPEDDLVTDWMTSDPDTFSPEVSVDEAAAWLLETGYRHLPVVAGDELLGVVSIRDLLWAITQGG